MRYREDRPTVVVALGRRSGAFDRGNRGHGCHSDSRYGRVPFVSDNETTISLIILSIVPQFSFVLRRSFQNLPELLTTRRSRADPFVIDRPQPPSIRVIRVVRRRRAVAADPAGVRCLAVVPASTRRKHAHEQCPRPPEE